jgi:hypothetical protein
MPGGFDSGFDAGFGGTDIPEVLRKSTATAIVLSSSFLLDYDPIEKHHLWQRWLHASINKHFTDNKGPLPLYLEGDERTLQDQAEFYELRIDGPFILQPHKGFYFINVEINVLVQVHMDPRELYRVQDATGIITKAFRNAICVYKYGNDSDLDNQLLLGYLRLNRNLDETVDINYFGIIKEDVRLTQATVEGHYQMQINKVN